MLQLIASSHKLFGTPLLANRLCTMFKIVWFFLSNTLLCCSVKVVVTCFFIPYILHKFTNLCELHSPLNHCEEFLLACLFLSQQAF